MKKLYRILAQTTNSYQPVKNQNYFQSEVLYCGFDKDKALVAYHESSPRDYFCGYGNQYRKTLKQSKEISNE